MPIPLPDCLVCRVPRLSNVEVALDPNKDFNHSQDSSLCFLPVCPSVSLSVFSLSACLSVCLLVCVCSSVHLRSSFVCLPSTVRHIVSVRFQTPYFRSQNAGHAQAEISDFRKQISKEPGQIPQVSDFRFQIPQRSRPMWHLHCTFQNAEFRYQAPRNTG